MLISAERQSLTLFHSWLQSTQVRPNLGHETHQLLAPQKLANLNALSILRDKKYFFMLMRLG